MASQWGIDWQFATARPPGMVERLQLPDGTDASRGARPEPFLNRGRASPDLRQASATPNGAHSRLERRVLEGMRHPTRGMRDLRTTGKPAVTQDQGATEIKRHRRWDPNAAGRMPPHLGA